MRRSTLPDAGVMVKSHPIFLRILVSLMILVTVELSIFSAVVVSTNVIGQASDSSRRIIEDELDTRATFIESTMLNTWANVGPYMDEVNALVQDELADGTITYDELGTSCERTDALLADAANVLLRMLRTNRVNGVYLVLCTQDLADANGGAATRDVPGVCFLDQDPLSSYGEKNDDVLIERSPASVVACTGISTAASWSTQFHISAADGASSDYIREPYAKGREHGADAEWIDLGYWGASQRLEGDDRPMVTYSVPLLLPDGTAYGVLGVSLTQEYVESLMPADELADDGSGSYFMGQGDAAGDGPTEVYFATGDAGWTDATDVADGAAPSGRFVSMRALDVYGANAPYGDTSWVLGCAVPTSTVKARADQIYDAFRTVAVSLLVVGVVGGLVVSYLIQRPVSKLREQLASMDGTSAIALNPTGIAEIDALSGEIERLNREVAVNAERFSKTIRMASEGLGSFQLDEATGVVTVSDGFFEVFGSDRKPDAGVMTVREFDEFLDGLSRRAIEVESGEEDIYEIPHGAKSRYVRLRIAREGQVRFGLAEDVTQTVLRNRMLVYERDHDALTGLYNRRAFHGRMSQLLDNQERSFTHAALLMMDLDNLKLVNDTYGHAAGDAYIRAAARTIASVATGSALCARISGDEFNVFFFGDDPEEIDGRIDALRDAFASSSIVVGDNERRSVRVSVGVARYPEDAHSYESLLRFADSAMYVAKRTRKGSFADFDISRYRGEQDVRRRRDALVGLIDHRMVHFDFQPIVDARTGDLFAYEALMRPEHEAFAGPMDVLSTARMEGKLGQVEDLLVPAAIASYYEHRREGRIAAGVRLFFNTISDQRLSPAALEGLHELYEACGADRRDLVMEVTEEYALDFEAWADKVSDFVGHGGGIAIDDYGTGYNGNKTLLHIMPDYIKVDIEITKNIDENRDKQSIMEYVVGFAHERGKLVVAEGVETEDEVRECIRLGADLLQGYFVARPATIPPVVTDDVRRAIVALQSRP